MRGRHEAQTRYSLSLYLFSTRTVPPRTWTVHSVPTFVEVDPTTAIQYSFPVYLGKSQGQSPPRPSRKTSGTVYWGHLTPVHLSSLPYTSLPLSCPLSSPFTRPSSHPRCPDTRIRFGGGYSVPSPRLLPGSDVPKENKDFGYLPTPCPYPLGSDLHCS